MAAQGLAIAGVALVALFPTPSDFVDAVFPQDHTEIVAVEAVSEKKIEVDVLTFDRPVIETIEIPRLKSCDYDLDHLTTGILHSCRDDLVKIATRSLTSPGLDPDAEDARLALIRLCQNQWGFEDDPELLLLHPECASGL